MKALNFYINGQKLEKANQRDFEGLQRGSKGYLLCVFRCSNELRDCLKIATFKVFNKRINVPIINSRCLVPDDICDWSEFEVCVNCKKDSQIITTNYIKIKQEG